MPFEKGDPNINKLDTLPEKFTKEFVDYVCHLYANNTSVLEMSAKLTKIAVVGQLKCFIKMLMVRLKIRSFTFQRKVKIER